MRSLVNIIIFLSLAVLIGAVAFFGIGVAAVVFQPGLLAGKTMAGALNSIVLRRLGIMTLSAGALLTGGMLYNALSGRSFAYWTGLVLSVAVLGVNLYISASLFPRMDALRVAIGNFDRIPDEKLQQKAEFDQGHKLYSTLTSVCLIGSVLVLILNTAGLVAVGRNRPARQDATAQGKQAPAAVTDNPALPVTTAHTPLPAQNMPAAQTLPVVPPPVQPEPPGPKPNGTPTAADSAVPPETTPLPGTGNPIT